MEREFSSITELVKAIQEGVGRIEEGNLPIKDLEIITREAAELYERLVVLRFKAYDELVKSSSDETKSKITTPIRISVPDNQINLIDAIEEEEGKGEEETIMDAPEKQKVESSEFPNKSPDKAEKVPEKEPESKAVQEEKKSIAESALTEEEKSLAEKLRKTPITDLKKSIGLNQKFQMITELFEGDNEKYDKLITSINSADNSYSAIQLIQDHKKELDWDEENKAFLTLLELTERRFL